MIVFIHKQYNIDNKISTMKHSFTESTSRICHTTGFYVCNSEYTDNFEQVSWNTETSNVMNAECSQEPWIKDLSFFLSKIKPLRSPSQS